MTGALVGDPDVAAAVAVLRARALPPAAAAAPAPDLALILGSGLGDLARRVDAAVTIRFAELPGFPAAGVAGHAGQLVLGALDGVPVMVFAGRVHLYEGHAPAVAALPVRLAHAYGARTLFVANAAGGIGRTLRAGDLMLIRDHINLMARSPLAGPVRRDERRFPDMSEPYDRALLTLLRDAARETDIALAEGVYAALLGPSYETPAEIRMLERLGADAVGMSTVPEVVVARALGMRVAGVSCVTNVAAGLGAAPLDHHEVLAATERVRSQFERLVTAFVRRVAARENVTPAAGDRHVD